MPSSKAQFAPFRGIHLQLQKPINWKTAEGTTGVAMFLRASGFEGLGLGKSIGNGGRLVRLLTSPHQEAGTHAGDQGPCSATATRSLFQSVPLRE